MRLLPHEQARLNLFLAAELARRRRGRGLRLSQAEATALIADETIELARDGLPYEDVERLAYGVLGRADVLDGVAEIVDRIELEPLFPDGPRLVVLIEPVLRDAPPRLEVEPELEWLDDRVSLAVVNEGQSPIGVTSHFHFFEVNRALRFDRRAAWGMRLAVAAGVKVFFLPGEEREVHLLPIGGARVVRGHGGIVDGSLDEPGALALALEALHREGFRDATS